MLLVGGGDATNSSPPMWSAFDDMWVLDVDKRVWSEVS